MDFEANGHIVDDVREEYSRLRNLLTALALS
jgi:hypothetical protein